MLINRLYYALKPWLPRRLTIGLRRLRAQFVSQNNSHVWPIDEAAGRKPERWPGWPEGQQFAFVLSHDVEGPTGVERVQPLSELEMSLGFRSSYNFIPEGSYRVTRELREKLTRNGFEVGVHDLHHDGKLYSSREGFRNKAQSINRYLKEWNAVGFRSGFMLHNLDWLGDLQMEYDASTFDTDPFEPQPDGMNTIFPFWVSRRPPTPDSPSSQAFRPGAADGYVELPYTLPQDITIFLLLREQAADTWKRKLRWLAERGGMVLVNVHPDYVGFGSRIRPAFEFPAGIYEDFLRHVRDAYQGRYWAALPKEVAAWHKRHRESITLSRAAAA